MTYSGKPLVDVAGVALFAELAVVRLLQRAGWSACWCDGFSRGGMVGTEILPDTISQSSLTRLRKRSSGGLPQTAAVEDGLGDEQAMRLLMLLARTGRRISELRMLDFDCLLAIHGLAATPGDGDAMVAKLRYQTKIHAEGAICGRRIFDAPTGP